MSFIIKEELIDLSGDSDVKTTIMSKDEMDETVPSRSSNFQQLEEKETIVSAATLSSLRSFMCQLEILDKKLEIMNWKIEQGFERMDKRLDVVSNNMEQKFDHINKKLMMLDDKLENREIQMEKKLESMEGKLVATVQLTDETKERSFKVESGFGEQEQQVNTSPITVLQLTEILEREEVTFSGAHMGLHPIEFIQLLEPHFEDTKLTGYQKLTVANLCLKGRAREWIREQTFKNYTEFKIGFQAEYWHLNDQMRLRDQLFHGQFKVNDKIKTMSGYVRKMIKLSKFLKDDAMVVDEMLATLLIKHLPEKTRNILIPVINSTKGLLKMLVKLEDSESSVTRPETKQEQYNGKGN